MSIKRYYLSHLSQSMEEYDAGDWIKFSDHQADIQRVLSTLRNVIDTVGDAPIESFGDSKYDQVRFPHIGEPQFQRWLRVLQGEGVAQ